MLQQECSSLLNETYIWLNHDNKFNQKEDCFEWKPKFRKPDSMWIVTNEQVDTSCLNFEDLNEYSKKEPICCILQDNIAE